MVPTHSVRPLVRFVLSVITVFWAGVAADTWGSTLSWPTPHSGRGCGFPICGYVLVDPVRFPYETDAQPYFDQFPVIELSAMTAPRWGRFLYRSDFARYGDQWTRNTRDVYWRIAIGLQRGEIVTRASLRGPVSQSVGEPQALSRPVRIMNPFVISASLGFPSEANAAHADEQQSVQAPLGTRSSGPSPKRIENPFAIDKGH